MPKAYNLNPDGQNRNPGAIGKHSVYIGSICATAATFCPKGYAAANGAILNISANQVLFSLIGTNYGGDGRITFQLPDLRGRSAIGMGTGNGLSPVAQGQTRGVEAVSQNIVQMASHTHIATSAGGSVAVTLSAKQVAGANSPVEGSMLGAGGSGSGAASIYVAPGTAGATVNLGGVTVTENPGSVVVGGADDDPAAAIGRQLLYCYSRDLSATGLRTVAKSALHVVGNVRGRCFACPFRA